MEADATQNKNVVIVCLNRIDACLPFFVCLLGQRYGWIPQRKDTSQETMLSYPGLERMFQSGSRSLPMVYHYRP
ncbi:MAG: hypothetical protein DDT34_01825 [Firmicutes bacterium]|nr:hypothetical protein [Bacillota bacterium]MBT9166226.1 hypothetical protein [Chloroflexota bacterium]